MTQYIARVKILERHADNTARAFYKTLIITEKTTVGDLMQWRDKKVHDPLNGEYASPEVIITPDDVDV